MSYFEINKVRDGLEHVIAAGRVVGFLKDIGGGMVAVKVGSFTREFEGMGLARERAMAAVKQRVATIDSMASDLPNTNPEIFAEEAEEEKPRRGRPRKQAEETVEAAE